MIYTGITRVKNGFVRSNKFVFQKKSKHFVKYKSFKNFTTNRKQGDWAVVYVLLIIFLWMGTISPFFHSDAKAWLNIITRGLQMVLPHIFNIRKLILSCPWALLWSIPWIIFPISSAENVTEDNRLLVWKLRLVGSLLWLAKREHCLEKKQLKSSPFSLKSVMKWSS